MIKTFRGLLVDGGQDTINLHTNDGKTGYRVVKFQLFPQTPGSADYESVVKLFKVFQTGTIPTSGGTVDFSDNTLVGAGFYGATSSSGPFSGITIFDQEIFNQDIYVTHTTNTGSAPINYYIELEQISLDLNEATVATLQSIRSS